jgi:hypothetical protein
MTQKTTETLKNTNSPGMNAPGTNSPVKNSSGKSSAGKNSPAANSTTKNRRREPRISANRQIQYLPTNAAQNWQFLDAQLLDCSPHGLGMECHDPLAAGEDFIVKLVIGKVRLAVYRVKSVAPIETGYRIGAEFIGLLVDPDEVDHDAIVAALAKPAAED